MIRNRRAFSLVVGEKFGTQEWIAHNQTNHQAGEKGLADLWAPMAGMSIGLLLLSMRAREALRASFNLKTGKKSDHLLRYGYEPVVRSMALAQGTLKLPSEVDERRVGRRSWSQIRG